MKISFEKLSKTHHKLTIVRIDHSLDSVLCETRSYLRHDLTHFAVESEAGLQTGFWGLLAAGKTLEDLNDRSAKSIEGADQDIMVVEAVVGVLHNVDNSLAAEIIENLKGQEDGLGWSIPVWLTEDFIVRIQTQMRQLLGHWNGTPYGEKMHLEWSTQS